MSISKDPYKTLKLPSTEAHPNKIERTKSEAVCTFIYGGFGISFGQFIET